LRVDLRLDSLDPTPHEVRVRQTQGAMLCPNCRKLISVNAERCPYCGAARPGLWGYGPALTRMARSLDPVTAIPIACVALYVLSLVLDVRSLTSFSGSAFGLLSPSTPVLRLLGATEPIDLLAGQPWTVLTAIYLHGSLLHILFNVLWIRSLAPEVRHIFGSARFFVIWSVAGAVGFVASDGLPLLGIGAPHPTIGASGSIFGLMAALIVYGRSVGESMMTRQLWTWAIAIVAMGFFMSGVDNVAHVGGFAGGWLTARLYLQRLGQPVGRTSTILALALLGCTLLGFASSVALAFLRFGG
jgi:membrane associated rhomboid family serine protease